MMEGDEEDEFWDCFVDDEDYMSCLESMLIYFFRYGGMIRCKYGNFN